jgi:hypothetical protein
MGYVVKAVSASGCKMWISLPMQKTHRVFGPREKAEIFRTQKEALAAVETVADSLRRVGFEFEVESAS